MWSSGIGRRAGGRHASGIAFTHVDGPGWGDRIMAFIDLEGGGFRWLTSAATAGTHAQVRP